MKVQKRYQEELLEWKERLYQLRARYRDTPPGFHTSQEEAQVVKRLKRERQEYQKQSRYCFAASYCPTEECFVGRQGYLARMEEMFRRENGPVILYGIGGIGKTALAREYIRKHAKQYDTVLFLSYNIGFQELICDDFQLPIENLRFTTEKYESKSRYFAEKMNVIAELARSTKVLLVIDDCNRRRDARLREVFSLPCDILVTTRTDPSCWGDFSAICVKELETEEEWKQFLRAYHQGEFTAEERKRIRDYRLRVKGHTLLMQLCLRGLETGVEMPEKVATDSAGTVRNAGAGNPAGSVPGNFTGIIAGTGLPGGISADRTGKEPGRQPGGGDAYTAPGDCGGGPQSVFPFHG